jgi:hypothetical protein
MCRLVPILAARICFQFAAAQFNTGASIAKNASARSMDGVSVILVAHKLLHSTYGCVLDVDKAYQYHAIVV